jgi:hypothetical protein
MNTSGRSLLAFTTNEPPISSTNQGGGKQRAVIAPPGIMKGKSLDRASRP